MPRKLPPRLKSIGFEIAESEGNGRRQSIWQRLDGLLRHPVILIVITSAFSVGVGTWLTSEYQTRQRQRDSITKSMDEVRASFDRTALAYEEFLYTAMVLNEDLVSSVSESRVTEDSALFRQAARRLNSQRTLEKARLRQEMPLGSGTAFELITDAIDIGTSLITDCLTWGQPISVPQPTFGGKKVECRKSETFDVKYADERIARVSECLRVFFNGFRPAPEDDFVPDQRIRKMNEGVKDAGEVCNNAVMLGYVLPELRRQEEKSD